MKQCIYVKEVEMKQCIYVKESKAIYYRSNQRKTHTIKKYARCLLKNDKTMKFDLKDN